MHAAPTPSPASRVLPAAGPRAWLLVLGVVSVLLHGCVLDWLREQGPQHPRLTPLPPPLLLRVLKPSPPAAPPARARAAASAATQAPTPTSPEPTPDATAAAPAVVPAPEPPAADTAAPTTPPTLDPPPFPPLEAASTSPASTWPPDTRLRYNLKGYYRGDVYGSAEVLWQHRDGRYQARVDLRMALVLSVTLLSQGTLSDEGLLPAQYEEQFLASVRRASFDGIALKFNDGTAVRQPPQVQDTASQFVELTRRFASGRQALAVGATVPVWLARPQQLDLWTYDVVALETLDLPELGAVPAYHLQPRPLVRARGPITAEMWFAPTLQYLPVRIRIHLGEGNFIDLLAQRIEQGQADPPP